MVQVPQPPAKATATRDALARALYGQLFLWIIGRINATMDSDAGTPRRFDCMLIASRINATMDSDAGTADAKRTLSMLGSMHELTTALSLSPN